MIVSDAKREANRRNALRSTGPKTPEGKEKSRRNALKHGLTALVVVPEDAAEYQARASDYFWSLKPQNKFKAYLVDEVALLSLRTERAQRIERKLREKLALRAITSWDDDRRLEAERVGRDLASRPSEVVAELKRTPQGCDWLLDRWAGLARIADLGRGWPEDCRRLAFDLLGTPAEFRLDRPGATIDPDGRVLDPGDDPAAVARGQIAALRLDREAAAEHDAIDRELAEADLTDETTPEIRRLRRYESALHRRLRWCMARFQEPIPAERPRFDLAPHHDPEAEAHARAMMEAQAAADRAEAEAQWLTRDEADAPAPNEANPDVPAPNEANPDAPATNEANPDAPEPNEANPDAPATNEANPDAPEPNEANQETGPAAPPTTPADRRVAQARKADSRRDAKKRKLDRRRA